MYWDRHDYSSLNLPLDSEGSSEESEGADEWGCEGGEDRDIRYLVGDVTRPQQTGTSDAIVVHCVGVCVCVCVCVCVHACVCITFMFACFLDDSGRWGKGGLFSALSSRSSQPQSQYRLAGQMKDLTLGDTHFIPIDDLMQRDVGSDMVCSYFKYIHDMVCILIFCDMFSFGGVIV